MSIQVEVAHIAERLAKVGGEDWRRERTGMMDGRVIEEVVEQGRKVATAHGGSAEPGAGWDERKADIAEFIAHAPTDIHVLLEQQRKESAQIASVRATARPLSVEDVTLNLIQGVHEDYNRGWLDAMREIQSVLDGAAPGRRSDDPILVGAEAIHDQLTMLGVDPDERGETPDQRSIAEILAGTVIRKVYVG